MRIILPVMVAVSAIISLKCRAQTHKLNSDSVYNFFRAQKKGTLSPNTQGAQGAGGDFDCMATIGDISPGATLCINNLDGVTINAGFVLNGPTNWYYGTYTWVVTGYKAGYSSGTLVASGVDQITVTKPGIYTMATEDGCWDQVLITSTVPAINMATTTCPGGNVALTAPAVNENTFAGIVAYQWYNGTAMLPGENGASYNVTKTGNYYAQTTDENGCVQNVDPVAVNIYTPPAKISITDGSCGQGNLSIDNSAQNIFPLQADWLRNDTLIQTFSNEGTKVAGGNGAGNGLNQLNQPYGIFVDSARNIYIADHDNNRVVKWAPGADAGTIVTDSASLKVFGGGNPTDVWLDKRKNITIAGERGTIVNPFDVNQISHKSLNADLAALTYDNNGNIYILPTYNPASTDTTNILFEKWNPASGNDTIIAITDSLYLANKKRISDTPVELSYNDYAYYHPVTRTKAFCIDRAGNFYFAINDFLYFAPDGDSPDVTDVKTCVRIVKWVPGTKSLVTVAGGLGADGNPLITNLNSFCVDDAGNIFIAADTGLFVWKNGAANSTAITTAIEFSKVIFDADGNLYAADHTDASVLQFSKADISQFITGAKPQITGTIVAGGNGAGKALNQLVIPASLFVDAAKNVFVNDYDNDRIVEWAPGATTGKRVISNVSIFINGFNPGGDFVIDKNQNLFISGDANLTKVSLAIKFYYYPGATNSVTGGNDSSLYLARDIGLEKWNPYTDVSSTFTTAPFINGIFRDSAGSIYTGSNFTNSQLFYLGRVVKYSATGSTHSTVAGGNTYTQIGAAGGVAADKKGNVYVGDISNNQVQVWKPGATAPNIIASGYTPGGIKLDNDGNIYVADQTNNRVMRYPAMVVNSINNITPGVYKAELTYPGGCVVTTDSLIVKACLLPLQFLNFTGQLQKNNTVLNWQTAQEINTSYFNIERSIDGAQFSKVGKTPAYNSNASKNNYAYTDANAATLPAGKLYYRLQEVDKDGAFSYSKIISINLNVAGWSYTVSPNPVRDLLNVQLKNISGQTNFAITGINGQRLMQQTFTGSGNITKAYNIGNLAAGTYVIQVTNNGTTQQQKFTKL